ncbi:MAG: helix-turn-helix transcriptional regulator [Sphingomonadales bacterium]|nr:helix-turn-helix transcriptional regulator [Sphingomonadales bacterium]MDE2171905.1 helix-turn-helix transcriptional regulator [Sphingomonadales bacterium]
MVKRADLSHAPCPVARSLDLIGDWWSLLIIRDALEGVCRFTAFQQSLGIARGMLADRLRMLVDHGIFQSVPASDGSAYREYRLTSKGEDLHLVVVALRQWGEAHLYGPEEPRSALVDRQRLEPVAPLTLQAADGRALQWPETRVLKAEPFPSPPPAR